MRRSESLWQGGVLFLVFLMTVGIYACLGTLLLRPRGRTGPTDIIRILEPSTGSARQQGAALGVRAAVVEAGFLRSELIVDGQSAGVRVNLDPQSVPWFVGWDWQAASDGNHTLVVRAEDSRNRWFASQPVTVTIVPRGKLVFASNRDGAHALYAMDADGQGLERLTAGPGSAQQPALGPGGLLAYVAETGESRAIIRWRDDERQEVELALGWEPAWLALPPGQPLSPGGAGPTWLAYTASIDGVSQVLIQQVPGGLALPLTAEEVYAGQPSWAPRIGAGSRRLAYVAERDGNWDIWLASLDGGGRSGTGVQRLTDHPATDWAPAWSPDGTRLAFVSDRAGSHQVYLMRADGTDVQALTNLIGGTESPAWSPDGFWLAVVAYTGQGAGIDRREIYLVRIDGQAMVRLTRNAFDDTDVAWRWEF